MRVMVVGLALVVIAASAEAQTMNAEGFHKRASALKKKGPMAIFSRGEIKALMNEGSTAGRASGAQRRADLAAGRKPRFCPPEKSSINSTEYMQRLGAIPPSERARIDMTEATNRIMAAKFPCKA